MINVLNESGDDHDLRVGEALLRHRFDEGERELFVPLADLARRAGRLDEARNLLGAGLDEFPERVSAWVLASRVEALSGRLLDAGRLYLQVLDLDASNLPALRGLAVAAEAAGATERARNLAVRWIAEDPDDMEAEDLLVELVAARKAEIESRRQAGAESKDERPAAGDGENPQEGEDPDA